MSAAADRPHVPGASSPRHSQSADDVAADVVLVSHGFQTNYERGFTNGLGTLTGYRVTLVSSDRTDREHLLPSVRDLNLRGSQDEGRTRWRKALNLLQYHARLMWHVARHPRAIVHVIGLIEPAIPLGVVQGLLFRVIARRYVLTVHNLLPHDRHSAANRRAFAWSYRIAHRLVVHTPRMRDRLRDEFGIDPARVCVMTHGIEPLGDLPVVTPAPATGRPRLLFFGIVNRYKGVDVLLRAFTQVQGDAELSIVGQCTNDALATELQTLIDSHPKRDRIGWRREYVAESEVGSIVRGASLLVMPYRHIDQSGVLFQALRYGTPVVATRVGSLADYIDADRGELCPPEDPAALAAAIDRALARLPGFERERIREAARAFEWPTTVQAMREVYE